MTQTDNDQGYYIVPKCDKEIEILYQDECLLVINKPEFLLSVPGRAPENKDCVISRLQADFPNAVMVHRLDLDTSGILIVPIRRDAMSHIARQFQERSIEKEYEAIVWGAVNSKYGSISLPIKPDWQNRPKQCIDFEQGKQALTHYERLDFNSEKQQTRLALKPITGRSHQLRIHCKEIKHPIIGCDMYAHEAALAASPRLLLHGRYISFIHPLSNKRMFVESQAPF